VGEDDANYVVRFYSFVIMLGLLAHVAKEGLVYYFVWFNNLAVALLGQGKLKEGTQVGQNSSATG
jgi:hypothetical protein